eukprot:TRINITY_DN165_c0_g2_i1.p1 TRINITY_DN165_c0_g2~~TRINITY_DN165_c0_g2_i1.p1  ORF type:complete len:416 (+),score=90.99 TRINITY_DN165_c0_g2_i1:160-1407(+)
MDLRRTTIVLLVIIGFISYFVYFNIYQKIDCLCFKSGLSEVITSELSSSNVTWKTTHPNIKTVFLAGFELINPPQNWGTNLPFIVRERYPNARIFAIKNPQIVNKSFQTAETGVIEIFPAPEYFSDDSVSIDLRSNEESLSNPHPDLVIFRNSHSLFKFIDDAAPWLLKSNALRVVHLYDSFMTAVFTNVIDTLLHGNNFLKPVPSSMLLEYQKQIELTHYLDDSLEHQPRKDNILLCVGKMDDRVGQLSFARRVDPDLLGKHNLTIVFVGDKQNDYPQVKEILRQRKVLFRNEGFVKRTRLIELFVRAKGIILTPVEKTRESSIIEEGLYGNTPFLVSPQVKLDKRLEPFGVRLENTQLQDLNAGLEKLLTEDWQDRPMRFARDKINESDFFDRIEREFCSVFPQRCSEMEVQS